MSGLLERIDKILEPQIKKIDEHIRELNPNDTVSYFDADWAGISGQVLVNRIFEKIHDDIPRSQYVTYLYTNEAKKFAGKAKPRNTIFVDYEPHEEYDVICKDSQRVTIFGHHHRRTDIEERCNTDPRLKYFNPRQIIDGSTIKEEYPRGIPIIYPLWKVAERNGIDATLITRLGFRGYGYQKLDKELANSGKYKKISEKELDALVEKVNLLAGFDLDETPRIIANLHDATTMSDKSLGKINQIVSNKKIPDIRSQIIEYALRNAEEFGDLVIFPVVAPEFDLIKPFVHPLNMIRSKDGKKTMVCVQTGRSPVKVSIRTDKNIVITDLLDKAFEDEEEKNNGGHEKSGGFICNQSDLQRIALKFLNEYFSRTQQEIKLGKNDLDFFNDLKFSRRVEGSAESQRNLDKWFDFSD